jgi:malate dehydrogenase (oxaloacetate-decarboxylating)(NADP+)
VFENRTIVPGQGNNVYIFPGVGLGAVICQAKKITDDMFLTAARTLAACVSEDDIAQGSVYPPFRDIRRISHEIGSAVAEKIFKEGLAGVERPEDLRAHIAAYMYDPRY